MYASGRGSKFISGTSGIARNTVKKYLRQFISLRLTLEDIEAMTDGQLARAFLLEKPKTESQRATDLEFLFPVLVARLKKRGITKKMILRKGAVANYVVSNLYIANGYSSINWSKLLLINHITH